MNTGNNRWTPDEMQFLVDHYPLPEYTARRVQREKPGRHRTVTAIHRKAEYLGLGNIASANMAAVRSRMVEDIYDMCVLDYTAERMAVELAQQYGIAVSVDRVGQLMRERLNPCTYRSWLLRQPGRHVRGCVRGWAQTRRVA